MSQKNERKASDVLPDAENSKKTMKKTFHGQEVIKSSMVDDFADKRSKR